MWPRASAHVRGLSGEVHMRVARGAREETGRVSVWERLGTAPHYPRASHADSVDTGASERMQCQGALMAGCEVGMGRPKEGVSEGLLSSDCVRCVASVVACLLSPPSAEKPLARRLDEKSKARAPPAFPGHVWTYLQTQKHKAPAVDRALANRRGFASAMASKYVEIEFWATS